MCIIVNAQCEGDTMSIKVMPQNVVTPTIAQNQQFEAQKAESEKAKQYKDPLMQWPTRGLAYSNELGAAISEVAPKLGTLLWFPAMLYFGADIYDKYKNEKNSYNPSAVRGTEQAVFQMLASVIMPTAAVLGGQKIASLLGRFGKDGLTLQSKEEILDFLQGHMARRNIADYKDDVDAFKNSFKEALTNHRKNMKTEMKLTSPIKTVRNYIFNKTHPEAVAYAPSAKILTFANQKIDEMFSIYNQLLTDDSKAPKEFSKKMFNNYIKIKNKFLSDEAYKDIAKTEAIDVIIKKFQKSQISNAKVLKTIGGFIALGLAIKPIDNFVEHTIMKKYVKPRLAMLNAQDVDTFRSKTIDVKS